MYIYLSLCLLPCLVLSVPVENVTVGTITLPKNVTPTGLPTESKTRGEQVVTKGMSPLPTITHPPLHTVEQGQDPHVESVEGDIEVTDPPMDWETGETQTSEPGGESQWDKELIEQELRDMEEEERLYRGNRGK